MSLREQIGRVAWCLAALLLFAGVASAQEPYRTFRVPFHTVNDLILLDAEVNGRPAVLLLDTGANRTALSVEITGADKAEALRATRQGLFLTRSVGLKVAELRWANLPVLIVDMAQRSHMHVDGLLGEDVLRQFSAVRIDYKAQTVTLEETAKTYRVSFHTVNGLILLDAEVNSKSAVLVLDTGARYTAVSQGDAPSLILRPGEAADSQAVRVTIELRLGDFVTIKPALALNLDTVQKQMATRFDGILAEDVLQMFSAVRIDYKNHVVELESK